LKAWSAKRQRRKEQTINELVLIKLKNNDKKKKKRKDLTGKRISVQTDNQMDGKITEAPFFDHLNLA
jgi:hypothetical protein